MKTIGKILLFASAVYTSYYVGTISGYVKGTLVTCKAFVEKNDNKETDVSMIKEVQEESNGQGSGN